MLCNIRRPVAVSAEVQLLQELHFLLAVLDCSAAAVLELEEKVTRESMESHKERTLWMIKEKSIRFLFLLFCLVTNSRSMQWPYEE